MQYRVRVLHDLKKISLCLKECKHDCFLTDLFDKLYEDVEDALAHTNS